MTGTSVTWTPPAEPVWNEEAVLNGVAYPTRNPVPEGVTDSGELLSALTDGQRDQMRAVHEAAHAVAFLVAGGHVHSAWVRNTADLRVTADPASGAGQPGGRVDGCGVTDGRDFAVVMGAGERAEDRWLRTAGLWTPALAAGVEFGAYTDRRAVLDVNPSLGFTGGAGDFLVVHEIADNFVAAHWDALTAVASVLTHRLRLTGDEIAGLAGLPNGAPSPTCDRSRR